MDQIFCSCRFSPISASARSRASATRSGAVPPGERRRATEFSMLEPVKHVGLGPGGKLLDFRQTQLPQFLALDFGVAHRVPHLFVGGAKRDALGHQVVGQVGGGEKAAVEGCGHGLRAYRQIFQQARPSIELRP